MRSVIADPMPADDAGIQGDVFDFRGLAQATTNLIGVSPRVVDSNHRPRVLQPFK